MKSQSPKSIAVGKQPQPPTAKGYFTNRALVPEILVSIWFDDFRLAHNISETDAEWFNRHAETWLRYFHANNKVWRAKMERESNADRDFLIVFICHWATAFVSNPEVYKERHPLSEIE